MMPARAQPANRPARTRDAGRAALLLSLGMLLACEADADGEIEDDVEAVPTAETPAEEIAAGGAATALPSPPVPPPPPHPLEPWPGLRAPASAGDRVYSKVRFLWIRPQPRPSRVWLGYLSLGDGVPVKGGDAETAYAGPGHGRGCQAWYAIEPTGYVCAGDDATLDPEDPDVVALRSHAADRSDPWPYAYGESLEVPVYHQLPAPRKQAFREPALARHLDAVADARQVPAADRPERFAGVDLSPGREPVPELLLLPPGGRTVQTRVANGSTLAFVRRFQHEDRAFLMTWDRGFVPADKVRPYPRSSFSGVALGGVRGGNGVALPLGWVRRDEPARAYRRDPDGRLTASGRSWPRLAHIPLTGSEVSQDERRYLETSDGAWVPATAVVVAARTDDVPLQIRRATEGHRTWLDISIEDGTLVAYENLTPVYATLISPGRGGLPQPGIPTLDTASTPTGVFSVLAKLVTATMVSGSNSSLVHAEVQFTQNISGPYALHGAYWHDRWGHKKSGGCVNLAPRDALRVFEWTYPRLPEGWHAMRSITPHADWASPTLVYLHR
ncbi:MAG: L,D-transpeptidase [Myxococcota bacterium]